MIKKNLSVLIITSIIILIPMIAGILLWNSLPEQLPIHWNVNGEVDGYGSKAIVVFAFPVGLLLLYWLGVVMTDSDPKRKADKTKSLRIILWLCPIMSVGIQALVYTTAIGYESNVQVVLPLAIGALFVCIGNYLPKCPQSYTIGIRLPWTLEDPDNWQKTHRVAGFVSVIVGIVILATAFLGSYIIIVVGLAIIAIVPMVYSYCYHRKKNK